MVKVYQLKITLKHIKPPIWRRFRVPGNLDLESLHHVIQVVMGWENAHLFQFNINRQPYTTLYEDIENYNDAMPADEHLLSEVVKQPGQKFTYEYDFGDGWEHEIVVEEIIDNDVKSYQPVCITGKRACPPEDCGGPWGYAGLLEAIKDPKHSEHEDMLEWLGGAFPEYFSVEEVNEELKP